ncbi:MAG TPA: sulfotransferase [Rhizomicrobium sp.]|nr:sulfotransferase [Rhizomicrobium sp.]
MSATPFFIVSSGRSGTAMLHKALSAAGDIEMHHEYMVHVVQPLAARRYHGLVDRQETLKILAQTHLAAARYSERRHWGDSSNKLSWLIPELAELMPEARFVHLVRDGRKVAGSYFNKLGGECYDDRSTAILRAHVEDGAPAPPPEKKYWWPLPPRGLDQFGRIAWHWAEINRVILDSLAHLAPERQMFVRLEDLLVSPSLVRSLFGFLELPYRDEHYAIFARPHNVNRPEDRPLTDAQRAAFESVAASMMDRLGYADRDEYVVNY